MPFNEPAQLLNSSVGTGFWRLKDEGQRGAGRQSGARPRAGTGASQRGRRHGAGRGTRAMAAPRPHTPLNAAGLAFHLYLVSRRSGKTELPYFTNAELQRQWLDGQVNLNQGGVDGTLYLLRTRINAVIALVAAQVVAPSDWMTQPFIDFLLSRYRGDPQAVPNAQPMFFDYAAPHVLQAHHVYRRWSSYFHPEILPYNPSQMYNQYHSVTWLRHNILTVSAAHPDHFHLIILKEMSEMSSHRGLLR